MESVVFKVDVRAGTVRVKSALFLGSTYAVEIEGYDYAETPPTITLSDHRGNPLAVSEIDEQGGYVISLDTQELLDYFKNCHWKGCVKAANVHCTVNTTDATLASSTMPVFWSQYYTAPSGTLTKIDAKGPKGDPGEPGPKGDKGDDGTVITARGFFHFTVDEDSHLWVHASREQDLYEMGPDGQPDTTKPLFILGDGTGGTEAYHLYYVVYDPGDGQTSRRIDLGYVKGQDGEAFVPDIDSVPTANSSNLVESGGVAQAIADAGTAQTAALNGAVATINTALGGKADLENGKVPVSQLPSFVSDVKEYPSASDFPEEGEAAKIYVAKDTNLTYRWGGSVYVEISESLALGETSSTAYAGNKGAANATAITAMKDGTNIDSFGDVETALAGKQPTISDLATIRSGAAAGATAYQKPSTGIPATDLAAAVQTSLGNADAAVKSVNGFIPDTSGDVQLSGNDIPIVPGAGTSVNESLQLLAADLRYAQGATITASAQLADRTGNRVAPLATNTDNIVLTFPDAVAGYLRDFLVLVTNTAGNTGSITFTPPTGAVVYGDGFSNSPASGETWLYSVTEVAANTFWAKSVKMEVAQ